MLHIPSELWESSVYLLCQYVSEVLKCTHLAVQELILFGNDFDELSGVNVGVAAIFDIPIHVQGCEIICSGIGNSWQNSFTLQSPWVYSRPRYP